MFDLFKQKGEKKDKDAKEGVKAPVPDAKEPNRADAKKERPRKMDIEIESAEPSSKDENVFSNLFPKKDQKTASEDNLIESLNKATSKEKVLSPTLKDDKELLIYKKPTLGTNLLKTSLLLAVLSFGYFHAQLSPTFDLLGENAVQAKEAGFNRVVDLQSNILKRDFILAKYALDDFLFTADTYIHKINLYEGNLVSQKEKLSIEKEFPTLQRRMRDNLQLAKSTYASKVRLTPDNLPKNPEDGDHEQAFLAGLKDSIRSDINAAEGNPEDLEFLRSVTRLADNNTLKGAINKYQIPSMTDNEFKELVKVLSESNTSSFGTLNKLRSQRIAWSGIVTEIEKVTKDIDPVFESALLDEKVGEIFYSSYNIDHSNNLVSVIGETHTDDGKNFTLSADLIDSFENSDLFENVEMNSFAKIKDLENQYKGVLTINFNIQEPSEESN